MGGGLIQLVAYGAQDIYLSGNPQITFFKHVYKRHTMFAIENFPQYPTGTINWGNKLTYTIDRKADLLSKSNIEFFIDFCDKDDAPLTKQEILKDINTRGLQTSLAKSLAYNFIDYIEVEINGTVIDRHTGHWLAIKTELYKTFNKRFEEFLLTCPYYSAPHIDENTMFISIPLQFWFNTNAGLALPLIALQHHDVKIHIQLNHLHKILVNPIDNPQAKFIKNLKIREMNLTCDYIYLDTEERRRFAQNSHEYLIEQLQILPGEYCRDGNTDILIPLTFNHPIKQIVWTIHNRVLYKWLGYLWSGQKDRVKYAKIQLNGVDRFPTKPGIYFQTIQKNNHYDGINLYDFMFINKYINTSNFLGYDIDTWDDTRIPVAALDPFVYSFALEPQRQQPTGSCNFSRLDNAVLSMEINDKLPNWTVGNSEGEYDSTPRDGYDVRVYGVNYNVLRITGGMGGLAYSN